MSQLVYSMVTSMDGFIEDGAGDFSWAEPDREVHAFFNDLSRPIGTHLLGRRMYETMVYWETANAEGDDVEADFARVWQAADKIVFFSATADPPVVCTNRTRIAGRFDPDAVRGWKEEADRDLAVGGSELAGLAIRAGLVDELQVVMAPVSIGAGKRFLPADLRVDLALLEERRFRNGMIYLRYRVV